ncbi:hypothetical protein SK128_023558, partial [Halocaridina rubra]
DIEVGCGCNVRGECCQLIHQAREGTQISQVSRLGKGANSASLIRIRGTAVSIWSVAKEVGTVPVHRKVPFEQVVVVHDLDAVCNTQQRHVNSETEGITGGCEANGSSEVLESAEWCDESGEVPALLGEFHLLVAV